MGLVRGNNEDNFYINGRYKEDITEPFSRITDHARRDEYLYAVCDGMGGEDCGEEAALTAVETLAQYEKAGFDGKLAAYVSRTNQLICEKMKRMGGARIGTTLALLYIKDNQAMSCNLGDSRTYLFRDCKLRQLSKDHTQAQRLVDLGLLKQNEAKKHKDRNKLTQHLGIFPNELVIEPYISEMITLMQGDVFLLCSDGLTDMVSDDGIARVLLSEAEAETMSEMLVEQAIQNGGKDNVTIIVVQVKG